MVTLMKSREIDYRDLTASRYRGSTANHSSNVYRILNGYTKDSSVGRVVTALTGRGKVDSKIANLTKELDSLGECELADAINVLKINERTYQKRKSKVDGKYVPNIHAHKFTALIRQLESRLSGSDISDSLKEPTASQDYRTPIAFPTSTESARAPIKPRNDYSLPIITSRPVSGSILEEPAHAQTPTNSNGIPTAFVDDVANIPQENPLVKPSSYSPISKPAKNLFQSTKEYVVSFKYPRTGTNDLERNEAIFKAGFRGLVAASILAGAGFISYRSGPTIIQTIEDLFDGPSAPNPLVSRSARPVERPVSITPEPPAFTLSSTMQEILSNQKPTYIHPFQSSPPSQGLELSFEPTNVLAEVQSTRSVMTSLFKKDLAPLVNYQFVQMQPSEEQINLTGDLSISFMLAPNQSTFVTPALTGAQAPAENPLELNLNSFASSPVNP